MRRLGSPSLAHTPQRHMLGESSYWPTGQSSSGDEDSLSMDMDTPMDASGPTFIAAMVSPEPIDRHPSITSSAALPPQKQGYSHTGSVVLASSPARPMMDRHDNCSSPTESDVGLRLGSVAAASFVSVRSTVEKDIIKTKVEEIEDAFSLLQACATTAAAKHEADKNRSESAQVDQSDVLERYWREELDALTKRHQLELQARGNEATARKEAEKLLIVDKYKQKLESFKEKVQEAENAYRQKHVQILGALDESRRELAATKASATLKHQEWLTELGAKDQQIQKLRCQLKQLQRERDDKLKWRSVAVEMASNIVELSCDATFIETPEETNMRHLSGNFVDKAVVSKAFLADLVLNSKVSENCAQCASYICHFKTNK